MNSTVYRTNPSFRRVGPAPPRAFFNGRRTVSNGNGKKSADYATMVSRFLEHTRTKFMDPTFLICMLIAFCLLVTLDNTDNPVTAFISKLETVDAMKTFAGWLTANLVKFIGLIAFLPAVLSIRGNKQTITFIMAFLWVWFIPEHTPYEYLAQGALLYLFMVTEPNQDRYRFFVILIAIVCYFFQFGYSSEVVCARMFKRMNCVRNCEWVVDKCINSTTPAPSQTKGEAG